MKDVYTINLLVTTAWQLLPADYPKFFKFFSLMNINSTEKTLFYEMSLPLYNIAHKVGEISCVNARERLELFILARVGRFILSDAYSNDITKFEESFESKNLPVEIVRMIFIYLWDSYYVQLMLDFTYDKKRQANNGAGFAISPLTKGILDWVVVSKKRLKLRSLPLPDKVLSTSCNSVRFEGLGTRRLVKNVMLYENSLGLPNAVLSILGDADINAERETLVVCVPRFQDLPLLANRCSTHGKKNCCKKTGEKAASLFYWGIKQHRKDTKTQFKIVMAIDLHQKKFHAFCTDTCKDKFDLREWDLTLSWMEVDKKVASMKKKQKMLQKLARSIEYYTNALNVCRSESYHGALWKWILKCKDFIYFAEKLALSVSLINDGFCKTTLTVFEMLNLPITERMRGRLKEDDKNRAAVTRIQNTREYKLARMKTQNEFKEKLKKESEVEIEVHKIYTLYPTIEQKSELLEQEQDEVVAPPTKKPRNGPQIDPAEQRRVKQLAKIEELTDKLEKKLSNLPEGIQKPFDVVATDDLCEEYIDDLDYDVCPKGLFELYLRSLKLDDPTVKISGNKNELHKRLRAMYCENEMELDEGGTTDDDDDPMNGGVEFSKRVIGANLFNMSAISDIKNVLKQRHKLADHICKRCEKSKSLEKCFSCKLNYCELCRFRKWHWAFFDGKKEKVCRDCFKLKLLEVLLAFLKEPETEFIRYDYVVFDKFGTSEKCYSCEFSVNSGTGVKSYHYCCNLKCRVKICQKCAGDVSELRVFDQPLFDCMEDDRKNVECLTSENVNETGEINRITRKRKQLPFFCSECYVELIKKYESKLEMTNTDLDRDEIMTESTNI